MSISTQEYQQLKRAVDDKQRASDKASGAFESLMKRLKTEFDCDSIDDAKAKLADLRKQEARADKEFNTAFDEFKSKHPDLFA